MARVAICTWLGTLGCVELCVWDINVTECIFRKNNAGALHS